MLGKRLLAAATAAGLVLSSCQSGGATPSPAPVPASPTPTPNPAPSPVATELPPPAAYVPGQAAPASAGERPYKKILRLAQNGASTEALLEAVRSAGARYDLTTPEILELRRAGVAEEVVEAMLRSGQPK